MSRDLVRMLDDTSLPDLLREDLTEAANQPLPPLDMAAGMAGLTAAIHGGGSMSAATASATAKAAALSHGSWWGGALIGVGAGLVGAAMIWFAPALSQAPTPTKPASITPATASEAVAPAPLASVDAPVAPPAQLIAASEPRALAALPAPSPPPVPSVSAPAEPLAVDGPAEELALLVRIKQQAATDPASAVALVDEGHRRFPRGSFYQERESIAILALARLGRAAEARSRAQRFLEAHPQSPYAERLRALASPAAP